MPAGFTLGTDAVYVAADAKHPVTINNEAGGTIYYKATSDVGTGDTAVAVNASAELTAGAYIISASQSRVSTHAPYPVPFVQTYSTATHTHAAVTASTAPAGGTGATAGAYDSSAHRDAMIASLTATQADLVNVKGVLNALIDDLQDKGIVN